MKKSVAGIPEGSGQLTVQPLPIVEGIGAIPTLSILSSILLS